MRTDTDLFTSREAAAAAGGCRHSAALSPQQQMDNNNNSSCLSVCVQFNVQYLAATGVLLQALTSDLQPGMHPKLSAGYVSYQ